MLTILIHALAATSLVLAPIQDEPAESARTTGPDLLKVDDLVLEHYSPAHIDTLELYDAARALVGRKFYVTDRGGYHSEPVYNVSVLADHLLLYDEADRVQELLATLATLDVDPNPRADKMLTTTTYVPRNITVEAARQALTPLSRATRDSLNVSVVADRRVIVLHDTEEHVQRMLALLESVDVPETQIRVTCYVLQAAREAQGGESGVVAPAELTDNLKKLLPSMSFRTEGFAMLQSAVVPGRQIALSMNVVNGTQFELTFSPIAYDATTGSVSVTNCQVVTRRPAVLDQAGAAQRFPKTDSVLSTDTVFRGNEYTVLGATGSSPVFVVVHVETVK